MLPECSGAQPALFADLAELRPGGSVRLHDEFATTVRPIQAGLIDVAPLPTRSREMAEYQATFDIAPTRRPALQVQLAFA